VIDNLNHNKPFAISITFLVFALGLWMFCFQIVGYKLEYIPGDLGDARFINYILEHGHQYISGSTPSFWNAQFMYPYEGTIAISDNMIGTLPIYSFWRITGLSIETSYQLWWISICCLNFWVTFLVVKRWFNRYDLAIIAAYVFAFTIFNLYQLSYLQMTIRFMIPIVIYAAVRLVETGKLKYLVLYSVGIYVQFLCVMYTGFFLLYFSAGFIVLYAWVSGRFSFLKELFSKSNYLKTIGIALITGFLMLSLMLPYLETAGKMGLKLYDEFNWNIPMISGYLLPHQSSLLWSSVHDVFKSENSAWWLHSVFIGLLPIISILLIPFIWIRKKYNEFQNGKLILALSITIVIITVLFIRLDNGLTLYAAIFKFPGMNSMRVLNRFMHVQLFFIVIFSLFLIRKWKSWGIVAVFFLLLLDNSFNGEYALRTSKVENKERREKVRSTIESQLKPHHKAFALVNSNEFPHLIHIDAMLVSSQIGLPTVNGYSSNCPDEFGEYFLNGSSDGLDKWMKASGLNRDDLLIIDLAE
jgi:hypothetical protein